MTIEELSARLESVERQNRRMRAGGIVVLVLVAAVTAMGQAAPPPKVIQALRLEIVDAKGTITASLGPSIEFSKKGEQWDLSDGPASLRFMDTEGNCRASFGVLRTGPALTLLDKAGGIRALLCSTPTGDSRLDFHNKVGVASASLGSDGLYLSDDAGQTRAVLGSARLQDPKTGGKEQTSPSSLVLFDKDGKVIERLPR